MKRFANWMTAVLACCAVVNPALADEEHSDIELGQNGSGKLSLLGIPDEPIFLDPVSGLINGWSAAEPGLFEVELTEEGVSPLDTFVNTGIKLELVSHDNGLEVIEAGLAFTADDNGESVALGTEAGAVHSHPTWFINSAVVGGSFEGTLNATFKLIDTNGNYAESDVFALQFTNVPEPGSALALLIGAGLVASRRRRG